jgi:hypothetical protein
MFCKQFKCLLLILLSYNASAQQTNVQQLVTKCWHDVVASNIKVRSDQFKLYQGSAAIGSTSYWMWSIFDAVVSTNDSYYYNPDQLNSLSSDYRLILYTMKTTLANKSKTSKPCNLNDAIVNFSNAGNNYVWNATISDLQSSINAGNPVSFILDTTIITAQLDTNSNGYNVLKNDTTHININAKFDHVSVFFALPMDPDKPSSSNPAGYLPWFSGCALNAAFVNMDKQLLPDTARPNWDAIFGNNGFLKNVCVALVAVDGINIKVTVTSSAALLPSVNGQLKATSLKPVSTNQTKNNIIFYYTTVSSVGHPNLLGVLVASIADFVTMTNK